MAAASDPVVIVSAARTPLGRFMGELSPLSAHQLGSHVIGAAVERAKLAPERIDEVYQAALSRGYLRADPGLLYRAPEAAPTPAATPEAAGTTGAPVAAAATTTLTIQYDTPDVGAVTAAEAALMQVPGVSSAATSSLALGGISLMRVGYAGTPEALKAALEARGWQVLGSGTTLRIRRAPRPAVPEAQPDNATAG